MKSKYFNGCYLLLIQVATRQKSNGVDMNSQIQLTGVILDSGIPILVSERCWFPTKYRVTINQSEVFHFD